MKTAILLYLYHLDLWEEYKKLILDNCYNYDLFLGLCSENDNTEIINDFKKNFKKNNIEIFKNKGVDIGPFLKQINKLDEKKYPFFIKLHGKKSIIPSSTTKVNWRVDLVNSLIGSKFTYSKNLDLIKRNDIGCIFNKSFLNKNQANLTLKIKEILNLLGMSYEKLSNSQYMMGSIYLSKTEVFKKYFSSNFISHIYNLLEDYGSIPEEGSYNHALEVVSGYILKNENLKIVDGIVKSKIIYNHNSPKNKVHLVKLYNNEYTIKENVKTRGIKNKNSIFWANAGVSQSYKLLSNNKLVSKEKNKFDRLLYKLLNSDLKNIKLSDAENHYNLVGREKGKVTKEDIVKVFDEKFYKNLYEIKEKRYQEIFQDYIIKGISGSRLYNPIIINDNFDYGFYESYNKIFENSIKYNQYTALSDYILTKKKCNNTIKYSKKDIKLKKMCIYLCEIKTKKDIYRLVTNLEILNKDFDKIIVYYSYNKKLNIKDSKSISYIKSELLDYSFRSSVLDSIDDIEKYNCVCMLNNDNIIINSIESFLNKFINSNCFLYSFTDCYLNSYHIDDSVLVFNGKNYKLISDMFVESKDKIELSKNLILKNYLIGSFFQINQEKELFWRNLFFDIKYFPSVLMRNNVPFIHYANEKYLRSLIPKGFYTPVKKYRGKIQEFFNIELNNTNITNNFNIDLSKKKICLVLHVMNFTKLTDYKKFIDLLKSKINTDVYITTNTARKKEFIKNKGMDIGPFIKTISKIDKDYDYVVKLHSKNLRSYRDLCFRNIIENIYHHILLLENNKNIICSGPNLYHIKIDNLNEQKIKEFMIRNKIKIDTITENNFFAGTMFIGKYKFFKDFIDKKIDPKEEYNLLEEGSVLNNEATNTHAWERILTNIIPNYYGMRNCSI